MSCDVCKFYFLFFDSFEDVYLIKQNKNKFKWWFRQWYYWTDAAMENQTVFVEEINFKELQFLEVISFVTFPYFSIL